MRDTEPPTAYLLSLPVDFRIALDRLGVDHLIVDPERVLVIFQNAVLDLRAREGGLDAAERVTIEVLDAPPQSAAGSTLIERFLEQLETTTGTGWAELTDT